MNRRTFLQTVGAVSVVGMSNISFGKEKQQWIKMKNRRPIMGEKVIVVANTPVLPLSNFNRISPIYVGCLRDTKNKRYFSMDLYFSYEILKNENVLIYGIGYEKDNNLELDKLIRERWLGNCVRIISKNKFTTVGFQRGCTKDIYWIPVSKEIFTSLPSLPKAIRTIK